MVAGAAIATGLDNRASDDALEEQDASMQSEDSVESEAATTTHLKHRIAHAHKHKVSASHLSSSVKPHSLKAGVGDNGVTQPWQFFATNYTLTLSWISFSVIIVMACFLGGVGGWCTRKACGERKSQGFDVDVNAHNLYT